MVSVWFQAYYPTSHNIHYVNLYCGKQWKTAHPGWKVSAEHPCALPLDGCPAQFQRVVVLTIASVVDDWQLRYRIDSVPPGAATLISRRPVGEVEAQGLPLWGEAQMTWKALRT